ncbi:FAD:protein FMN transferase [Futiania mangrovi]|uniref:FAD:protein FMN transferase n=1 Tax=Futiania mangrovi TaxID=2959716 RepID=A0A9J6PGH2_9PROT|nr:FAD:protein FMN transferase [Futiania mangrovii]MCP1337841.1 FAD:protein FMN transferase [Futiania mangrovii]
MIAHLTRRRFLTIAAAACALPSAAAAAEVAPVYRWRGIALGAPASMTLSGIEALDGARIAARVEAEVVRLEAIFSLYRPASALLRLNAEGRLEAPPPELLEVFGLCDALWYATGGVFDPTVQPLWALKAMAAREGRAPSAHELADARRRIGWRDVAWDERGVAFARPGMAMTLNGIAQGFVTDRIARLLHAEGLSGVLIDMGEIAASGHRPDGSAWRAGIADPQGRIVREVRLGDRALATSAPLGPQDGPGAHVFDPRTGGTASAWSLVSVSASSAMLADGLSTALCLVEGKAQAFGVAGRFQDARIEVLASAS